MISKSFNNLSHDSNASKSPKKDVIEPMEQNAVVVEKEKTGKWCEEDKCSTEYTMATANSLSNNSSISSSSMEPYKTDKKMMEKIPIQVEENVKDSKILEDIKVDIAPRCTIEEYFPPLLASSNELKAKFIQFVQLGLSSATPHIPLVDPLLIDAFAGYYKDSVEKDVVIRLACICKLNLSPPGASDEVNMKATPTLNDDIMASKLSLSMPDLKPSLNSKRRSERIMPIKNDEIVVFKCPLCSDVLSDVKSLTRHIRLHNNPSESSFNQCTICSKILSSQSSLDRHMLVHSGERPFECCYCTMTFTTNGNMHRHMRIHSKEESEPVHTHASGKCSITGSKYGQKPTLDSLIRDKKFTKSNSDSMLIRQFKSNNLEKTLKRNWKSIAPKSGYNNSKISYNSHNSFIDILKDYQIKKTSPRSFGSIFGAKKAVNSPKNRLDDIFSSLMFKSSLVDSSSSISNCRDQLNVPVTNASKQGNVETSPKRYKVVLKNEEAGVHVGLESVSVPINTMVATIKSLMYNFGNSVHCSLCKETFDNVDDFVVHAQTHHSKQLGFEKMGSWTLRCNEQNVEVDIKPEPTTEMKEKTVQGSRSRKQTAPLNLSTLRSAAMGSMPTCKSPISICKSEHGSGEKRGTVSLGDEVSQCQTVVSRTESVSGLDRLSSGKVDTSKLLQCVNCNGLVKIDQDAVLGDYELPCLRCNKTSHFMSLLETRRAITLTSENTYNPLTINKMLHIFESYMDQSRL